VSDALTIPRPSRSSRRRGLLLVAAAAVVLGAPAALAAWLTADGGGTNVPVAVPEPVFEEETGVRVTRIAVVGGGGIVDFRFQVLDPDKAIAVHGGTPLALVDEETGGVISTAFHGRHSGGTTQVGLNVAATYYLLFANSAGELAPGDRASVLLGDVRLEHVRVQ
jgi:hypothetical protein